MHFQKSGTRQIKTLLSRQAARSYSKKENEAPLYLNPHAWKGLPADRIYELHNLKKNDLGDKYNPSDEERNAILSTFQSLGVNKPPLEYVYEIDNFKERYMNNTPLKLRGLPPKRSNVRVVSKGATPHEQRRAEELHRISAYEMPLLAKLRQPYQPKPDTDSPITLSFKSSFPDENKNSSKVYLLCDIKDLKLDDKQAKKLKILAGNRFNFNTNKIHFTCDKFSEITQNSRWLVDTFNRLLAEAKDLSDDFSDIPLDDRSARQKDITPAYPVEWLRPEDAPIARYNVVQKLVDDVKRKKDMKYISKYSP